MVLRPEAVRARLLRLEEVVSRLAELGQEERGGFPAGFRAAWAIERGLQLAAEIVFDTGNHVLSAHFGVSAQDYEDIIAKLAEVGVIDSLVRDRLKGLGGFRSFLVHGYLALDPARVREALRRAPTDFTDFAMAMRGWLARTNA